MPAFSLPVCRSVLMTSGKKPCLVAGTAWRHRKLPPPWPTSKITPRLRAAMTYGSTCPCSLTIGKRPRTWPYMCVRMSPGRRCLLSRSSSDSGGMWPPKSIITGTSASVPASTARSTGFQSRPVVVRHLDADDQALVLEDAHRRQPGVHVGQVLLGRPALHPRADDVEEGEDAGLRRVDDVGLELAEVAPAGAADVDQRRLAAAERVAVGQDRRQPVAQVGVGLGAVEHVGVQVDEPGHDVQARRIDDAARLGGVDRRRDLGDLAVGDGDVHEAIAPVLRVDDVTALDEDGVRRLRGRGRRPQDGDAPEGGEQQGS